MRRALSTALLTTVLLGVAACGTTNTPTASESPSDKRVPSPTAAATLDKAAACVGIKKDMDQITQKGGEILGTALKAATDPSLQAKAIADLKGLFVEMRAIADKHGPTAADPEVKAALTEFQTQVKARQTAVEAAGTDLEKVMNAMDDPAFEAAGDKLDTLCN